MPALRASRTSSWASLVLPTPGSPRIRTIEPRPATACSMRRRSSARSSSRPTYGVRREDGRGDDCGRLLLPGDFEQAPAFGKALQAKAAAVPELKVFGGSDDAAHGLGGKDLTASRLRAD